MINYGLNVLIKEPGNTPLYLCFNNICLKQNTEYCIYLNLVNNLYNKNLFIELK